MFYSYDVKRRHNEIPEYLETSFNRNFTLNVYIVKTEAKVSTGVNAVLERISIFENQYKNRYWYISIVPGSLHYVISMV